MLIALGAGISITFLSYLDLSYRLGGMGALHTVGPMVEPSLNLQTWLNYLADPDYFAMFAMSAGFGVTMLLTVMKMRFLWWPFHPIGYVIGTDV